jgi:hypothetical protein
MDRQFRPLLTQTVTVNTLASKGTDGAPTYSTSASTYSARVLNVNKQIRDAVGNVQIAAYEVWIDSTGVLSPQSKYTLPDGTTPPVLHVIAPPDEVGTHHVKVLFGF